MRPSLGGTHRLSIRVRSRRRNCGRLQRVLRATYKRITRRRGGVQVTAGRLRKTCHSLGHLLAGARARSLPLRRMRSVLRRRRSGLGTTVGTGRRQLIQLGTFSCMSLSRRRGGLRGRLIHRRGIQRLARSRRGIGARVMELRGRAISYSVRLARRRTAQGAVRHLCRGTHVTIKGSIGTLHRRLRRKRTYPIYNDASRPCRQRRRMISVLFQGVRRRCGTIIVTYRRAGGRRVTLRHSLTRRGAITKRVGRRLSV